MPRGIAVSDLAGGAVAAHRAHNSEIEGSTAPPALTVKQRKFVDLYLGAANGNGSLAARQAGYPEPGARTVASRLLRLPHVQAEIQRLLAPVMSRDEVLARVSDQARGLPAECWRDCNGKLSLDLDQVRELGLIHLITSVADTNHGQAIKIADSQSALGLLAKYHGLVKEQVEHSGDVNLRFAGWTDEELDYFARTGERPRASCGERGAEPPAE